jgi:hypothetical protein
MDNGIVDMEMDIGIDDRAMDIDIDDMAMDIGRGIYGDLDCDIYGDMDVDGEGDAINRVCTGLRIWEEVGIPGLKMVISFFQYP